MKKIAPNFSLQISIILIARLKTGLRLNLKTELFMKGNGEEMLEKALEYKLGLMGLVMRDTGSIIKLVAKENLLM
jgi:hypothetical protein